MYQGFAQDGFVNPQTWHTKVADGAEGSLQTVIYIKKLVIDGTKDFVVREAALRAIQHVPERDITGQIHAIHEWVKRTFKYVSDAYPVEQLSSVRAILYNQRRIPGYGHDCDDFVILESALLRSIGIPTQVVIAACDKRRRDQYSHIYLRAYNKTKGKWVNLDATNKKAAAGWEPYSYMKKVIPIGATVTGSLTPSATPTGADSYSPQKRRSKRGTYGGPSFFMR